MRPQPDNTLTLAHTNGSDYATPNGADTSNMDIDEPKSLSRVPTTAEPPEWQATIEKVVKNVVAIHFCQTCSFDTDPAMSSEATGFVVDVERGYILTNRHVVGPGPFWGHCIFDNHEEVSFLMKTMAFIRFNQFPV
jgi:S1-C subfamily serine protease